MGDAANLRQKLNSTNEAVQTIQSAASSMMRLYSTPSLAVTEWRNTLQTCQSTTQLLPLLYVANEVLQNSKRNRGNKFLEAFSPVLPDSLKFICSRLTREDGGRNVALVEKVRRTAKIWGDRRVFSTRFVGSILKGLEEFRNTGAGGTAASSSNAESARPPPPTTSSNTQNRRQSSSPIQNANDQSSDNSDTPNNSNSDSDSDDSLFESSKPSLLSVTNISKAIQPNKLNSPSRRDSNTSTSNSNTNSLKRRRSSGSVQNTGSTRRNSGALKKESSLTKRNKTSRPRILSPNSLISLLEQMYRLDVDYDSIRSLLQNHELLSKYVLTENDDTENDDHDEEIDAVGDELLQLHTTILQSIHTLKQQRSSTFALATQKKEHEDELKRYINYTNSTVAADEEEIAFCDGLEEKLLLLKEVQPQVKRARDSKREEEARERALEEARMREKEQEEKLKQSLEETLRTGTTDESKPGMVWNQGLREYQYRPDVTEESWRD